MDVARGQQDYDWETRQDMYEWGKASRNALSVPAGTLWKTQENEGYR
jgi:hypothetical protein